MRVLVCGWVGSTNLGDELVLAGVRRAVLDAFGPKTRVAAVSTDPTRTRRMHGIGAVDHRRIDLIARAARQADLVVLGGGGLIQDETSPFNLPYHLSRAWTATAVGTPWVGLALGVGRLDTGLGRRLAQTLTRAAALTVRDQPSLDLLSSLAVPAGLACDAVVHLDGTKSDRDGTQAQVEDEQSPPGDALVVSLRPWSGPGGLLPVGWRRGHDLDAGEQDLMASTAAALDRAARHSGLPVRLVAFQTDRDAALHERIAAAMTTPATLVVPDHTTALPEVARGRVVVAMRYHAGLAATLAGRPSVLIGYSPKVDALAGELGTGAAHLPFEPSSFATLDEAILQQLQDTDAAERVRQARENLRQRRQVNIDALRTALG